MSDLNIPPAPLPTLDRLGLSLDSQVFSTGSDTKKVSQVWLDAFDAACSSGDVETIMSSLLPGAFWRDMLALTWDLRTFSGNDKIRTFLNDRLILSRLHNFRLREKYTSLQHPYPDVLWISLMFDFETDVGHASGVVRLVPTTPQGNWKAYTVFTNLESLRDFPEKIGPLRNFQPSHGVWEEERRRQTSFVGRADPKVLVIGAGQSGLVIAARLKMLGVDSLIVERNERIGDNWRKRYQALCLHDPVWYDHMPYLPFPPNWPVYTPSQKLAKWLEHYAVTMELDVWTSSTITSLTQDQRTNKWHASISQHGGVKRNFVFHHVIFCTGLSGVNPNIPLYPGLERFRGQVLHSSQHNSALDHTGKKVVVVGSGTSAHDIAQDYAQNGIDVTMIQRGPTYIMSTENGWPHILKGGYWQGGPPSDIVDRINASSPYFSSVESHQRRTKEIADLDKDLIDSLNKVGFRTNLGIQDTGFSLLARHRAGGYYLDTGASKLIVEGKIKLKNDSEILDLTQGGIKFKDGSELIADVVVSSTGLGKPIEHISTLCGDDVAKRCKPIWGFDAEGEINGAFKNLGVPGLWYMLGNLAMCRFHSSHLALQIKAIEEGILTSRYELHNPA